MTSTLAQPSEPAPPLEPLIDRALGMGADECELVRVDRRITTIRITDSCIAESKQVSQKGYGLRMIRRRHIVSAAASDPVVLRGMIDDATYIVAAENASVYKLRPENSWRGLPHPRPRGGMLRGTYDGRLAGITRKEAEELATRMLDAAGNKKQIGAVTGSLNIVSETFELHNTNQVHHSEISTYVSGFVNVEASASSGMGHSSSRTLAGFEPERAGDDACSMCMRSTNPVSVDEGRYTVVFEPYSVGELLAFVMSPNFGLKQVSEGRSCFSQQYADGGRVAPEAFSIYDDPHAPEGIGSHSLDAEGVPTARRPLIKNGMLVDTYSDLFDYYKASGGAAADGLSSGNAARMALPMGRSADPIPVSAPHNVSVSSQGGADAAVPVGEMIRDVRKGLLVGRLWYTYAVNPIKGDFSCTARSGVALILNGQITSPAKPVRIIHGLPALLRDISGVGDDTRNVIQWASLPSITPSLRVENVPVRRIS